MKEHVADMRNSEGLVVTNNGRKCRNLGLAVLGLMIAVLATSFSNIEFACADVTYKALVSETSVTDVDGWPLYADDDVTEITQQTVVVTSIEGASGSLTIPQKINVIDTRTEKLYTNVEPTRLNVSGSLSATNITSLDISACGKLESVGLSSLAELQSVAFPKGSALTSVYVNNCPLLQSLKMSACAGLESLIASGNKTLSEIDVKSCTKLTRLQVLDNALSTLKTEDVPSLVGSDGDIDFNCTSNGIGDTTSLVERFGEDSVLPQTKGRITSTFRNDVAYAKDSTARYLFSVSYQPSSSQSSNWLNDEGRAAKGTMKVVSNNEAVATVSASDSQWAFTPVGEGEATITATYDYETYHGTLSFTVTVVSQENPVKEIVLEQSTFDHAAVASCPLCKAIHLLSQTKTTHYELIAADPSKPLTYWELSFPATQGCPVSLNASPSTNSIGIVTNSSKAAIGSFDSVIQAVNGQGVTMASTKITSRIVDAGEPALNVKSFSMSAKSSCNLMSLGSGTSNLQKPVISLNDAATIIGSSYASEHVNKAALVKSVVSSNEDVVVAVVNADGYSVVSEKSGTATLTITDVFGNVYTSEVSVFDSASPDTSKLKFKYENLTISQGTVVWLLDTLLADGAFDSVAGSYDITTSNGNIVHCGKWATGPKHAVARNIGSTTLNLYYVNSKTGEKQLSDTIAITVVDSDVPSGVNVIAIEIEGSTHDVVAGTDLQLKATLTPSNAENADALTWSSSDESVATVDSSGKVSAVAPGDAVITSQVGVVSASYSVKVSERVVPAVSVQVSSPKLSMNVGEVQKLSATVMPEDTTDALTWASTDVNVLSIDGEGNVTAVGNGKASITATAGKTTCATGEITVTTPVVGVSLDAKDLALMAGGAGSTLKALVNPTTASNQAIVWTTSDEKVATVDSEGNVTPVSAGSARIKATTVEGGFIATCAVSVVQPVEGISFDKHEINIMGKHTVALKATVLPADATDASVRWTSSNEYIASVDSEGNVSSVGPGEALITAQTSNGAFSDVCKVKVSNPATSIVVNPASLSLVKGQEVALEAMLKGDLSGEITNAKNIQWSSNGETVATVDGESLSCKVIAHATGSAMIAAKISDGESEIAATCGVTVTNPATSISLSESTHQATVGDAPFVLTTETNPSDADDPTVSWSSDDQSVAVVDQNGEVTIKSAGQANITASVGDVVARCVLSVASKQITTASVQSGVDASVEVDDVASVQALEEIGKNGLNLSIVENPVLSEKAQGAIEIIAGEQGQVVSVLEINFKNNAGENIAVTKDTAGNLVMTVKVRITDAMRKFDLSTLTVSYVGDDGVIEKKQTWVSGDYLCFSTEHFSNYVVAGTMLAANASNGNGVISSEGAAVVSLDKGIALAATGDINVWYVFLLAGVCMVAGLISVVARKR